MEHQQAYGDIHRIQTSTAWEDSTAVEDEQPAVGGKRRRTDTVLRVGRARVLICDPIPAEAIERLSAGGLQVHQRIGLSPGEIEALIGHYDAVVVRSATKLGERQIAAQAICSSS